MSTTKPPAFGHYGFAAPVYDFSRFEQTSVSHTQKKNPSLERNAQPIKPGELYAGEREDVLDLLRGIAAIVTAPFRAIAWLFQRMFSGTSQEHARPPVVETGSPSNGSAMASPRLNVVTTDRPAFIAQIPLNVGNVGEEQEEAPEPEEDFVLPQVRLDAGVMQPVSYNLEDVSTLNERVDLSEPRNQSNIFEFQRGLLNRVNLSKQLFEHYIRMTSGLRDLPRLLAKEAISITLSHENELKISKPKTAQEKTDNIDLATNFVGSIGDEGLISLIQFSLSQGPLNMMESALRDAIGSVGLFFDFDGEKRAINLSEDGNTCSLELEFVLKLKNPENKLSDGLRVQVILEFKRESSTPTEWKIESNPRIYAKSEQQIIAEQEQRTAGEESMQFAAASASTSAFQSTRPDSPSGIIESLVEVPHSPPVHGIGGFGEKTEEKTADLFASINAGKNTNPLFVYQVPTRTEVI